MPEGLIFIICDVFMVVLCFLFVKSKNCMFLVIEIIVIKIRFPKILWVGNFINKLFKDKKESRNKI